jgi:hypothetical protein
MNHLSIVKDLAARHVNDFTGTAVGAGDSNCHIGEIVDVNRRAQACTMPQDWTHPPPPDHSGQSSNVLISTRSTDHGRSQNAGARTKAIQNG